MGIEAASHFGVSARAFGDRVSLAHDLRRPLSAITLGLEWLLEPPADADAPRSSLVLDVVRRNILFMNEIIGAQPVAQDAAAPNTAGIDVLDVLTDVVELYEPVLRARSQSVTVLSFLRGSCVIRGLCGVELKRILVNLLDNAGKFAPAGDDIRIEVRDAGSSVRISVIDHGPGVAPADRRLVFNPGYRGAVGADIPGLGFGLAYLARVVRAAGGRFGIRRRGRETSVWFTATVEAPAGELVSA